MVSTKRTTNASEGSRQPPNSNSQANQTKDEILRQLQAVMLYVDEQIGRFNTPTFKGSLNFVEAEAWIDRLETLFSTVNCSSQQKVHVVKVLLEGRVKQWWYSVRTIDNRRMVWNEFNNLFFDYFFLREARQQKEVEFYAPQQENMHEDQFIAQFIDLSNYMAYLNYYRNTWWMAIQLMEKARLEIKQQLAMIEVTTFEKMCTHIRQVAYRMREAYEYRRRDNLGGFSHQTGATGSRGQFSSYIGPINRVGKKNS
ncbi:uncharacterized protein LOC114761994 [Neltuma alba]|uniref:uncharacterized protein LOC114761994 n=1 Tax=Neltuma alba TaxID=207710 RepID=UPI0010A334BB|nr:uncharacterized protein LOC114761994 [Prosopis alba]